MNLKTSALRGLFGIVAYTTLMATTCNQQDASAPASAQVSSENIKAANVIPLSPSPVQASDKMPVHCKLADGTMMRITQVGDRVHFYKTASGYAGFGGDVSVPGASVGADWSESQVYRELDYLELLALFHGRRQEALDVLNIVSDQKKRVSNSVDTSQVQQVVIILTLLYEDFDIPATRKLIEDNALLQKFPVPEIQKTYGRMVPVFIRLDDWNLLRISESSHNGKPYISFAVTASGYGASSMKGSAVGVGASVEMPTSMTYNEISPLTALAYVNNNWKTIYNAAYAQSRIFVSPNVEAVKQTILSPDISRETDPSVNRSVNPAAVNKLYQDLLKELQKPNPGWMPPPPTYPGSGSGY